jgi:hypothetical protein
MSRQAEADRERRSRVISAEGELQASAKLAQSAEAMSATPSALQLRLLETVVEVSAEKNSTLVLPFPVELLRFFDRAAGAAAEATEVAPDGGAESAARTNGAYTPPVPPLPAERFDTPPETGACVE